MLVCHCRRISDREIRDCARSGSISVEAVAKNCGASSSCGGCRPEVERLVRDETSKAGSPGASLPTLSGAYLR